MTDLKKMPRVIANRFLTDGQRKKIKSRLAWVQSIPLRVFGVSRQLRSLEEQMGRLKTQLGITEGKLRIALYGMPTDKVTLETLTLRSPVNVFQFSSRASEFLNQTQKPTAAELAWSVAWPSRLKAMPEKVLDLSAHADLAHFSNDIDVLTEFLNISSIKLLSFEALRLDSRLCELTSKEWVVFFDQLHSVLTKVKRTESFFVLGRLPNLSAAHVFQDRYWSRAARLRFYSRTWFLELMANLDFQLVSEYPVSENQLNDSTEFWEFTFKLRND